MRICHYTHDTNVEHGAFGIMEPQADVFTDYKQINLILVPGMVFDRHGYRLDQGKGYYDHFLSRAKDCYKIGVYFSLQPVDETLTNEHDIRMNGTITQKCAED